MTTIPTGHMTGMDGTGWAEDGVTPHPAGGYVRVERRPHRTRYVDVAGRKHRLDGPAAEWADGPREWWFNGQLHRLDGPAVELANGTRQWWVDGKQHRLDGPAIELADGFREWWVDGERHRLDGPAIERADGTREWWLRGAPFPEPEYVEIVARLRETGEVPEF